MRQQGCLARDRCVDRTPWPFWHVATCAGQSARAHTPPKRARPTRAAGARAALRPAGVGDFALFRSHICPLTVCFRRPDAFLLAHWLLRGCGEEGGHRLQKKRHRQRSIEAIAAKKDCLQKPEGMTAKVNGCAFPTPENKAMLRLASGEQKRNWHSASAKCEPSLGADSRSHSSHRRQSTSRSFEKVCLEVVCIIRASLPGRSWDGIFFPGGFSRIKATQSLAQRTYASKCSHRSMAVRGRGVVGAQLAFGRMPVSQSSRPVGRRPAVALDVRIPGDHECGASDMPIDVQQLRDHGVLLRCHREPSVKCVRGNLARAHEAHKLVRLRCRPCKSRLRQDNHVTRKLRILFSPRIQEGYPWRTRRAPAWRPPCWRRARRSVVRTSLRRHLGALVLAGGQR